MYRLNDTRGQKVKYSRLAREKEEEIGMLIYPVCECVYLSPLPSEEKVTKIATLRKANRESERERRGVSQHPHHAMYMY